jgi:hypothetical protein
MATIEYIELMLTPVEAQRVLQLLDADHKATGNQTSKSAAKKVWRHLQDALKNSPPGSKT